MNFLWFFIKKIILSGDVETNPGPQSKRCQEFSICHWNLNSIVTHSFIKVLLLKAYITLQLRRHLFARNISQFKYTI